MKNIISNIRSIYPFFKGKIPGQLIIQITNRCNASCPQCGMRKSADIKRAALSPETARKLIDNAALNKVKAVSITGGEPLLYPEMTKDLLLYSRKKGIRFTRTGTNGFFFSKAASNYEKKVTSIAKLLKKSKLRNFWVSIDSSDPDIHESIRGFKRVIEGIYSGLPILHENGIFPCANLGINRAVGGQKTLELKPEYYNSKAGYLKDFENIYEKAFINFFEFVCNLGFTMVNCCYPMSVQASSQDLSAVYSATSADRIVNFLPEERPILFKALSKAVSKFRSRIRIFTPASSLYELYMQYQHKKTPTPCRGGKDFFFAEAETGNIYPCGFRGDENFKNSIPSKNQIKNFNCSKCDWECFRDPSTLLTPLTIIGSHPFSGLKKIKADKKFYNFWLEDIKYYMAAEFFDGTKPPDYNKLLRFKKDKKQSLSKSGSQVESLSFS